MQPRWNVITSYSIHYTKLYDGASTVLIQLLRLDAALVGQRDHPAQPAEVHRIDSAAGHDHHGALLLQTFESYNFV